ncbi:F0F1 ATP synthase subunit alpha, partial [Streptococcus pneumoniae]
MTTNDARDRDEDAWLTRGRAALGKLRLAPQAEVVGRVEHVADGIARVSGLPHIRLNELLQFEG